MRLCTSIENVEMLQHQENDERCRDGQGISRVSPEQLQMPLLVHGDYDTVRQIFLVSICLDIFWLTLLLVHDDYVTLRQIF